MDVFIVPVMLCDTMKNWHTGTIVLLHSGMSVDTVANYGITMLLLTTPKINWRALKHLSILNGKYSSLCFYFSILLTISTN